MKRPLAMYERAMYLNGGFHVNVMVTARIRGYIAEQRMEQALARVQAKHSVLRCLIVQEGNRPGFMMQDRPTPIPLRIVERRNDDDWVEVSMHESLQRFDGSRQPLARLIWVRGEMESELLLVCSHAICDGRSLLTLLQEILLLCDRPDADIGSPTTLNAIEEIFPARLWADRGLQRRIYWKAAVVKLLLRFARAGPGWTYGKIYRSLWTLDEQSSQLLVARCKAERVNLFAALSAATMLAFRAVCGGRHLEKFEAPVDIRRFLPDLRTDSLFAIAPTITLSLRKLRGVDPVSSDFWTLARALKTDMDRKIDGLDSTVYENFLGMEHMHDAYDRMVVYAQSKRAGQQVSLSYVGKLELAQHYRDFRLQEICDISAMMEPTPANLIAIYSFAGQFHFSLASDESSLPYAQALQIKEQVTATLLACLTKVETPAAIPAGASSALAEVS
jgi:Condensation domain